jgi:ankyrin repeat protein
MIQTKGRELDEGELSLLQQVISFAEGVDEVTTWRVHEAAKDDRGMAEALQEDGWAKDALDNAGRAPLHLAVGNDHAEAVQQLIQSGADVDITDMHEMTPLLVAARNNRTTCMRLLLNAGCRIDQCSIDGSTALHWAAQYGSADAVRLLLDAKETKTKAKRMATATESAFGRLPLHDLASSSHYGPTPEAIEEIARLLLEAHPDGIELRDNNGETPLLLAVRCDNLPLVRCLSRRGASWAAVSTRHRWNLMHFAVRYSTVATLDFLLQEAKCSEEKLHLIDHQLRTNKHSSPWDLFIASIYAPPWRLGDSQHRDKDDRAAFINFYQYVRDKNIRHDINVLQNALNAWPTNGAEAARDHLLRLAAHKAAAHNQNASNWYRGIAGQPFSGDEDTAVEMIEQDLQDLNDELQSSPWDQTSRYDYLAEESRWIEFPNHSFWIEPADSFVLQDVADSEHVNDEEGRIQQNDHPDDDPAFVSGDVSLDYGRITHIYSVRGQLLYDHGKHHCGAMQLLKSYVGDSAISKARFPRALIERMVGADDDGDPEELESDSASDSGACTSGTDESSGSNVETEAY